MSEAESRYIPFEDEDGNHIYFQVQSSQGNIPVRIDGITILEEQGDRSQVGVDYQIDSNHPDCPDLEKIDEEETLRIMSALKENVPRMVQELLNEAAEYERNQGVISNE